MADTVTWSLLRELASFRAEKGCATSLYLNLDPSEVPTAADVETRANSLLSEAHRMLEKRKGSLGHEVREALKGLLAGSIPCSRFCSVGELRVLTFLVPGLLLFRSAGICFKRISP